jgi:hypothetical protein
MGRLFFPAPSGENLSPERVVNRVRTGPNTGWLGKLVALLAKRTAVTQHPWRVGEKIGWMENLRFQRHFKFDVVTVANLAHFPSPFSHGTPP